MDKPINVTDITGVIYVDFPPAPGTKNAFTANLSCNELIFSFTGDSVVRLGNKEYHILKNSVRFMPRKDYGIYEVTRQAGVECIDIFFHTDKPLCEDAFVTGAMDDPTLAAKYRQIYTIWLEKKKTIILELWRFYMKFYRRHLQIRSICQTDSRR